MRKSIFFLLLVLLTSCKTVDNVQLNRDYSSKFQFDAPVDLNNQDIIIIDRTAYCLAYNKKIKVSNWVAYTFIVTDDYKSISRESNPWKQDPLVDKRYSAKDKDYKIAAKFGFDRGHQCPDASARCYGISSQLETYYFTNCTPQYKNLNRNHWKQLEAYARNLSTRTIKVYVLTGPLFDKNKTRMEIGENKISVPDAYFCIISRIENNKLLHEAYIFKNIMEKDYKSFSESLIENRVTIDKIEELSGLDLFMNDSRTSASLIESER